MAANIDTFKCPGLFQKALLKDVLDNNAGQRRKTSDAGVLDVDSGMPQNPLQIYKAQNSHGVRGVQPRAGERAGGRAGGLADDRADGCTGSSEADPESPEHIDKMPNGRRGGQANE